jgi:hypothetical protein
MSKENPPTDSTTKPAYDSPAPNPQITFADHVTDPEQRRTVERSVATLVARSAEAAAQARAAEAERAKLMAAFEAPYMKLIKEDPAAIKALDDLRTRQFIDLDSTNVLRGEQPLTATNDVITIPLREARASLRFPPYDFSWSWFRNEGSPPFSQLLSNTNGHVGLDARSGSLEGGASGFVEAHAGFGLVLSADHPVMVRGTSLRRMRYSFVVRAVGIGANATSEGGMELTALEDGSLLRIASDKMWRSRVSASFFHPDEFASDGEGPFAVFDPRELEFPMQQGRAYTFNVGIWVFSDSSTGVGAAAVQSFIEGDIHLMNPAIIAEA